MSVVVESFSGPPALLRGLRTMRERGITPRGLLFLALSPDGTVHVGVPHDPEQITSIKVGEKLALGGFDPCVNVLEAGEQTKNTRALEALYDWLAEAKSKTGSHAQRRQRSG